MGVSRLLKGKEMDLQTCKGDCTVSECIKKMNDKKIGALVVVDTDGNLNGIVTERDIMRMLDNGSVSLETTPVSAIMTGKEHLIKVGKEANINSIMDTMTNRKVRHLPIVEGNRVIAMVSIGDVVKTLLGHALSENESLKHYIMGS